MANYQEMWVLQAKEKQQKFQVEWPSPPRQPTQLPTLSSSYYSISILLYCNHSSFHINSNVLLTEEIDIIFFLVEEIKKGAWAWRGRSPMWW